MNAPGNGKDHDQQRVDGLGRKAIKGAGWAVSGSAVRQLWRIPVAVLMAHLLSPEDFGLAAIALAFMAIATVFSDLSLGAALIQRSHISELDRSTVFWATVALGCLMTAAGIAASGSIASFYGESEVRPLLVMVSFVFLLQSLSLTQASLLHREMKFRATEIRLTAGTIVGTLGGVVVALRGGGPWAIVVQELIAAVVAAILLWHFSPWRPHVRFSWVHLSDLGSFGFRLFGARALEQARGSAYVLLIGRLLGPAALGFYTVGLNLVLLPLRRAVIPIQEAFFPAFARLQAEPKRLGEAWRRANRLVLALLAPAVGGLCIVSADLVPLLLGRKWEGAVPVIQISAPVILVQSSASLGLRVVISALGRSGLVLRLTIVETTLALIAFPVGQPWGIAGVVAAFAISNLPVQMLVIYCVLRVTDISLGAFLSDLKGISEALLAMIIIALATSELMGTAGAADWLRLIVTTVVGIATYAPLCAWRSPGLLDELRTIRRALASAQSDQAP